MVGVEASRITMRNIDIYIYLPLFLNNETNWIFFALYKNIQSKVVQLHKYRILNFLIEKDIETYLSY